MYETVILYHSTTSEWLLLWLYCGQKGEIEASSSDLPSHVKAQIERNRWKFARKNRLNTFYRVKKEVFSMLYLEVIRMVSIDMAHSTTNEPIDQKG